MKRTLLAGTAVLLAGWGAQAQNFPETKLTASDGAAFDSFGFSVAVSDGTVLVGAPLNDDKGSTSGAAYIFDADRTETKLTATDGAPGDRFGTSVALSGGTALVGAPADNDFGTGSGSAYLFDTDGIEMKLSPSDAATGDGVGGSVALSGGTALVGARLDGDNGDLSGSAYLFDADGGQTKKLTASDGAAVDLFGSSVALSGGTALVGAPGNSSGSAYLFDADGTETMLTASDGAPGDQFGSSVALSGDIALVGVPNDNVNGPRGGSAYLFDARSGSELAKLTASDGASNDRFGFSVALSGNLALVGARGDSDNGTDSGSAYLFDARSGAELAKLTASDGAASDDFGFSVALDGSTAVVGASGDNGSAGAAYVYDLSPTWTASFGGAYDDAGNWNVLTPDTLGLDVKIDPDSTQTITGPAGASEVGTLFLGRGAGVATLDLQQGGGIFAEDGVEIGANGSLQGTGGIVGDIRNGGEIGLDGLSLTGDIENAGIVEGNGRIVGALTNDTGGEVRLGEGDRLIVQGDFANAGEVEALGATVPGADPTTLDFRGTVDNDGQFSLVGGRVVIQGDVANGATGTILTGGGGETIFFDDLANAGVLQVGDGSTTTIVGDYSGPGSTAGGGTVIFEGAVDTGASPALVSFTETVLTTTTVTTMELGGTERGTGYDAWDVNGTLTLGGRLVLENIPGFVPKAGDGFTLFSASDGITGEFDEVLFSPLASGQWRTVRTANTYRVEAVPLPAGAWLLLSGLGLMALRRRA